MRAPPTGFGIDIIQNCEVLTSSSRAGAAAASRPRAATIRAERVGVAVAGHSSTLAAKAGFLLRSTPTRCRPSFPSR